MSWPTTTFRSELPPVMRKELDALAAVLRGLLSIEHNSEGGHTDISAVTVTVDELLFNDLLQRIRQDTTGDGGLRIDLKQTVTSADGARLRLYDAGGIAQIAIGKLQVGTGLGAPRPAIRFAPFAPGIGEGWAIGPHADAFDQGFAFTDVTNAQDVLVLYRLTDGNYALCRANNSTAQVDLGQSASALKFRNLWLSDSLLADKAGITTGIYEQGRATPLGWFIDRPFDPANFTCQAPMTWTIDGVIVDAYSLVGKTLIWHLYVQSTIGGTPAQILTPTMPLPGGIGGANRKTVITGVVLNAGMGFWAPVFVAYNGGPKLDIYRIDAQNFQVGICYLGFQISFWVG